MSWSSVRASPRASMISWRSVTNASVPLRPALTSTDVTVVVREISSPMRKACSNWSLPPAHIRRGSCTGGRMPLRRGWPSTSSATVSSRGVKSSQCHNRGNSSPGRNASPPRSSVAAKASAEARLTKSVRSQRRPIHAFRLAYSGLETSICRSSRELRGVGIRSSGSPRSRLLKSASRRPPDRRDR